MSLPAGTYKFINVASGSSVRSYKKDETIYVASTRELPGPFEHWEVTVATAGYTIKNVGLNAYCKADASKGEPVITDDASTVFEISNADEETYVIKIAYADLVWTVGAPIVPRGEINLEGAQGSDVQKFRIVVVDF